MRYYYTPAKREKLVNISPEAEGLEHRLKAQCCHEDSASGLIDFNGHGKNKKYVCCLLGVTQKRLEKILLELENLGIIQNRLEKEGKILLCWWSKEQDAYFRRRHENAEYKRKSRGKGK